MDLIFIRYLHAHFEYGKKVTLPYQFLYNRQ